MMLKNLMFKLVLLVSFYSSFSWGGEFFYGASVLNYSNVKLTNGNKTNYLRHTHTALNGGGISVLGGVRFSNRLYLSPEVYWGSGRAAQTQDKSLKFNTSGAKLEAGFWAKGIFKPFLFYGRDGAFYYIEDSLNFSEEYNVIGGGFHLTPSFFKDSAAISISYKESVGLDDIDISLWSLEFKFFNWP